MFSGFFNRESPKVVGSHFEILAGVLKSFGFPCGISIVQRSIYYLTDHTCFGSHVDFGIGFGVGFAGTRLRRLRTWLFGLSWYVPTYSTFGVRMIRNNERRTIFRLLSGAGTRLCTWYSVKFWFSASGPSDFGSLRVSESGAQKQWAANIKHNILESKDSTEILPTTDSFSFQSRLSYELIKRIF